MQTEQDIYHRIDQKLDKILELLGRPKRCRGCGSQDVNETASVWIPKGHKAYRCGSCYKTWWEDSYGVEVSEKRVVELKELQDLGKG